MIPRKLFIIGALGVAALSAQQPPVNVSMSPSSGSGSSQTFSFVSSSSAGWQNIAWQEFIINYGVDAGGACFILVYPGSGAVYISSDTGWTYGNGWAASGTLGAGTIQNSQCRLNLAASSASGSGNNVTTALALTFEAGLPGPQNVYMWTGDNSGLDAGQQMGTWTTSSVSSQPPTLTSVAPSGGSGLAQSFSYAMSSVNGSNYLMQTFVLFNSSLAGQGGCYVLYYRADNALYFVDDAGDAESWAPLGKPGTLSNSQCSIDTGASTAVGSGNNFILNLQITFNANWAGAKYNYVYALDRENLSVGWAQMGTWTVGAAPVSDPRRTGILTSGSYWGGGGEQIDALSGNLNFSIPLLQAQTRTGQPVPVNLTYNSQNWEQQNGVNVQTGHDVGYGFGWQFMLGSITPVYAITQTSTAIDHYVYTDGSGAQYKLNVNSNNVWSSTQGIYVWFDANANQLHFRDGSWWLMGSTSSSGEPDYETMYPTQLEDVNGNQIVVTYLPGAGIPISSSNTSARINTISDPRWNGSATFSAFYNSDSPVPHLTTLRNYTLGTSGDYNFTYASAALSPPFGYDPNYAGLTTTHLASVATAINLPYYFTYDTAGAGELTQAAFPYGGHLRWSYLSDPYTAGRVLRAVGTRYLAADSAGATEWSYPISRDNASSASLHATMTLSDASGVGAKTWNFGQTGLVSSFVQSASAGGAVLQSDSYGWAQDPAGNPYIASKSTVTGAETALSTQTLDQYGNVTQSVIYPYNNTSSPLKTYSNTYLNSSAYTSHYVLNRLASTVLTTGGTNNTLVTNNYDVSGFASSTSSPTTLYDSSPPAPASARGNLNYTAASAGWTQTQYYPWGTAASVNGSNGTSVTASADPQTNFAAPMTITAQSYTTSISYNGWLAITQTTGSNGEQLSMTYDPYGRPSTGTSPYGAVTRYGYGTSAPFTQQQTGPTGVTTTTLDGLGRAIRVARGDTNGTYSYTDTVYAPCACSPLAKIQQVSQPYVPGSSNIYWTAYTYDGLGRTLTARQPDGASTTTYSYSGNQLTVWDPAGNWKQFTSDVLNNLTTVVEPDPANQPSGTLATNYSYDWMNHVTGVTMTRGSTTQTRTFLYDNVGRLTSAANPENGTVSYVYNGDNTLQYKQDARGQQAVYTYDSQKRLTMVQYYPQGQGNSEDGCQRVTYSYDTNPLNSGFSQYSYGRLTATQYGVLWGSSSGYLCAGATTTFAEMYSYHPAGAVTAKQVDMTRQVYPQTYTMATGSLEVDYTYDSAGHMASTTYPMTAPFPGSGGVAGTFTLTYGYDSMGRPDSLTDNNSGGPYTWAQNVQYDYAGRMTSLQAWAGQGYYAPMYLQQTMSYNVNGQLSSLNWATNPYGSFGSASGIAYNYSSTQNNGQITQAVDTLSGETIGYQYDSLKRLTSASSSAAWTQSYQYDGFGNLTAKVLNGATTPIAVNAATNRLSNAYYDANGNMTSGAGAGLTYDERNRVATATEVSGGMQSYQYTADNKRFYVNSNDGQGNVTEQLTFYGARGEKLGVYSIGAIVRQWSYVTYSYVYTVPITPVATNVWFAGRLILESNLPVYQDRLGTNRAAGARFMPYGDEITSTANDHIKFATYTRDGYTGLDYADQRYYVSTYGRFATQDPSGSSATAPSDPQMPQSWNRYFYAGADPVNNNDPTGLDDCDPVFGCDDPCFGDPDACGAGPDPTPSPPANNCVVPGVLFQLGSMLGAQTDNCWNNGSGPIVTLSGISLATWNQYAAASNGIFPQVGAGGATVDVGGGEIIIGIIAGLVKPEIALTVVGVGAIEEFGSGPADCAKALADLVRATYRVEIRVAQIVGTPDQGHVKALLQAYDALKKAVDSARRRCGPTVAAAAAVIAAGEAALAAAETALLAAGAAL